MYKLYTPKYNLKNTLEIVELENPIKTTNPMHSLSSVS